MRVTNATKPVRRRLALCQRQFRTSVATDPSVPARCSSDGWDGRTLITDAEITASRWFMSGDLPTESTRPDGLACCVRQLAQDGCDDAAGDCTGHQLEQ